MPQEIKRYDRIVLITFIFLILTRICTLGYIAHIQDITSESVQNVVSLFEANPIMKYVLVMQNLQKIILTMVIPSFGVALYIYLRKKVNIDVLGFFVNFIFLICLLNMINDATIFLASIM